MWGPHGLNLAPRTIFNLLGPLSNPAGVKKQITGVYSKTWVEPLAHVLKNLGSEACWICHGEGGLDEIVPTGTTSIAELKNGSVTSFEVTPEAVGLKRSKRADLLGGDAAQNAEALRVVLSGAKSAFSDAVVMTTGAALFMDGKTRDYASGVRLAEKAIDSGAALAALEKLVKVSNS